MARQEAMTKSYRLGSVATMFAMAAALAISPSWTASAVEVAIHCPQRWPTQAGTQNDLKGYTINAGRNWYPIGDHAKIVGDMERSWTDLRPGIKYKLGCGYTNDLSLVIPLPGRPIRCESSDRLDRDKKVYAVELFCVVDVDDPKEAERVRIHASEPINETTTIEGFRPRQSVDEVRRAIADGGWLVESETRREGIATGPISVIELRRGIQAALISFSRRTNLAREVHYMEPAIPDAWPLYDRTVDRFGRPNGNEDTWRSHFDRRKQTWKFEIRHAWDHGKPNAKERLIFLDRLAPD